MTESAAVGKRACSVCLLAVLALSCASPRQGQSPVGVGDEPACSGITIESVGASFRDAFAIEYTVTDKGRRYCIPREGYFWSLPESVPVELWRDADASLDQSQLLAKPLLFRNAKQRELKPLNPLGTPSFLPITGGKTVGEVQPGTYRLMLRYRPAPCRSEPATTACTAWSAPFRLEKNVMFAIDD